MRLNPLLCCLLLCISLSGADTRAQAPAKAEALSPASAINVAGRQRMLSQRMAKAYVMIGMKVDVPAAQKVLDESIALFDSQLARLKDFAPNDDTRRVVQQLAAGWQAYRDLLTQAPSRALAKDVYDSSDEVLAIAHRLVLACEKAQGAPQERLLNFAGRQRMLSQRLAKLYFYIAWDVNAQPAQMEFNMTRGEFASGMASLARLTDHPEARAALETLDREWIAYRTVMLNVSDRESRRAAASEVAAKSESVLAAAEKLVSIYERSSK
jgi:hypothetical protein